MQMMVLGKKRRKKKPHPALIWNFLGPCKITNAWDKILQATHLKRNPGQQGEEEDHRLQLGTWGENNEKKQKGLKK